jgi:site-specific recombinase XerD
MTRQRTSLSFDLWPQDDRTLWQRACQTGAFLEPDGPASHWAEATRKQVTKGYAKWLGYLGSTDQIEGSSSPSARISKLRLTGFVSWMEAQGLSSVTIASRVTDLAEAIRIMEPDADRTVLGALVSTLRKREVPSRAKHARILHPEQLLKGAITHLEEIPARKCLNELIRAGHYRDTLVIAFLAARPIRLKNITSITLGQHLMQQDGTWICRFAAAETKEKRPLSFSLPHEVAGYLETYIERYRPLLLKGNEYPDLWISIRGTPMSEQAIYWNTCRLSETLFGHRINPHLFRDCTASALATDAPDHVLAAARILGHASLNTTLKHYEQSDMIAAVERLHDVLFSLKHDRATP